MQEEGVILIVDDDEDYACLLRVALQEARVANPVEALHDGAAAVDYLKSLEAADLRGERLPALIFLDLKMPRLNGLEVLSWMRTQPRLAEIPVVVFTGAERDIEHSEALAKGATSFRIKPFSFHELIEQVNLIRNTYLHPETIKHAA